MTWVYLHLATNHFPIILTVLGTGAAVVSFAWRRRAREAWTYALVTLLLAWASVIPAWITGNQSHEVVEKQLGIKEGAVESHEEMAEGTLWITFAMGGLAAFAWWRTTRESKLGPPPGWVRWAVLGTGLAGSAMLGYTALLGGRIVHGPQAAVIRPDTTRTKATPPAERP
jgi:uncharacterized membrane protein